jgi:hypothetical protein
MGTCRPSVYGSRGGPACCRGLLQVAAALDRFDQAACLGCQLTERPSDGDCGQGRGLVVVALPWWVRLQVRPRVPTRHRMLESFLYELIPVR